MYDLRLALNECIEEFVMICRLLLKHLITCRICPGLNIVKFLYVFPYFFDCVLP